MREYKGFLKFMALLILVEALIIMTIYNLFEKDKNTPLHEHVRTKQFITRFKTAPVVFCKTEDKIVIHDGTHSDIVLPVILFPDMEKVE